MKIAHTLTIPFAIGLVAFAAANALATEGVSPGAVDRMAQVNNACPTFSWGMDSDAVAYDVVAYLLPDDASKQAELTAETEVLFTLIAGSATSWTPSAEQCFAPGGRYVWFVRSVTELIDEQVIEAGKWSAGRYFQVPAEPSAEDVARAIEVLKQWEAASGGGSLPLFADAGSAPVPAAAPDSVTGSGSNHLKSVPTASAAIRGEHPDMSGEKYGVVGTSASVDGAGVAAANLDGGPDLVLDGSAQGVPDTTISESGIDRVSASQATFTLQNSGAGRIDLDVIGDVFANTIDIEEIKINGSTVVDDTGEWMGLGSTVPCTNCVGSTDIADGSVATADLADSSVDYQKIAIGNVRTGHLQDGAVRTDKIFDGAVTTAKLAPGAVGSAVLGPDSVDSSHIVDGAVTSAEILNGTITRHDLSEASVGGAAIVEGSITSAHLAEEAVTTDEILDGTISYRDLAANAVRSGNLQDGAVATNDLAAGAVTSAKIADGTIAAADLAAGSVGTSELATGAVTMAKLAPESVGTHHIEYGGVEMDDIASNAVGTEQIVSGGVETSDVLDGTLTAADMDPAGGVYSSKSAVYVVEYESTIPEYGCTSTYVDCSDANDLALAGGWRNTYADEVLIVIVEQLDWDSMVDPARFHVKACNVGPTVRDFDIRIVCVSVPGS